MKQRWSLLPLLAFCLAPLARPQANPASSPATPPPAQTSVKPHGPDAVAAQDPSRVVATINGQKLTAKQVADLLKPFTPEQRQQINRNLQSALKQIYMQHQLAGEAQKLNLESQQRWKDQVQFAHDQVMMQAYLTNLSETEATDPQKYYDEHPAEFDQWKLSGIFVSFNQPGTPANSAQNSRTEEQAKDKINEIAKKLKDGGDFAVLARAESEHPSASKGGEIGAFPLSDPNTQFPAELKAAVTKLQPGQYTEPIRVQSMYAIVRLDSREKLPFDQAKDGITQRTKNERVKKEIDKYDVKVEDPDFFDMSSGHTASKIPTLARPGSAVAPPPPPPAPPKNE